VFVLSCWKTKSESLESILFGLTLFDPFTLHDFSFDIDFFLHKIIEVPTVTAVKTLGSPCFAESRVSEGDIRGVMFLP